MSKPFCFLHVCCRTSLASIKSHHLQFSGVVEHPILGNHCVCVQRLGVHLIVVLPEHNPPLVDNDDHDHHASDAHGDVDDEDLDDGADDDLKGGDRPYWLARLKRTLKVRSRL